MHYPIVLRPQRLNFIKIKYDGDVWILMKAIAYFVICIFKFLSHQLILKDSYITETEK